MRFFDTFGFLSFPGRMADRIAEITDEFESLWAARGTGHAGKPHDGTARSCIVQFIGYGSGRGHRTDPAVS